MEKGADFFNIVKVFMLLHWLLHLTDVACSLDSAQWGNIFVL